MKDPQGGVYPWRSTDQVTSLYYERSPRSGISTLVLNLFYLGRGVDFILENTFFRLWIRGGTLSKNNYKPIRSLTSKENHIYPAVHITKQTDILLLSYNGYML